MIGVTLFGLIFTPVFYVLSRKISAGLTFRRGTQKQDTPQDPGAPAAPISSPQSP
jgi:hypothetical protein